MIQAKNSENIVLFRKFHDLMEANLAKTKLDAFGIPCFLTNEHISSLYPLPFMVGMEVGLYIFRQDKSRVADILNSIELS